MTIGGRSVDSRIALVQSVGFARTGQVSQDCVRGGFPLRTPSCLPWKPRADVHAIPPTLRNAQRRPRQRAARLALCPIPHWHEERNERCYTSRLSPSSSPSKTPNNTSMKTRCGIRPSTAGSAVTIRELTNIDKVFDWAIVWGERRNAEATAAEETARATNGSGNGFDSNGCAYSVDQIEQIVREGAPPDANRTPQR